MKKFPLIILSVLCGLILSAPGCGGGGGGGGGGGAAPAGTVSKSVDNSGGTVESDSGETEGTVILVPAGAVAGDTEFTIEPGTEVEETSYQAAGEAIQLDAEGVTFATPVTVTIPYDPTMIPAGKTPADLVILKRNDSNLVTVLIPDSVDTVNETLSVDVTSFSTFQASSPTIPDASTSTVTVSPSSIIADGADASTISVVLRDSSGNPVVNTSVSIASSGSANSITQPGATDASGTTSGSLTSTVVETKSLTVVADPSGAAIALTAPQISVTQVPVDPSTSTVLAVPGVITADGADTATVTVTVTDANGNPLSGRSVSIAVSGSGNTISQPGNSDGSGVANGSFTTTVVESKSVTVTVDGTVVLTSTPTVIAAAVPPAPADAAQSSVTLSSATMTADGSDSVNVNVTVRDASGNPLSGRVVQLSISGSGNSIVQPSNTDGSGVASGTFTTTVAETKTVTVTVDGAVVLSTTPTVTAIPGPVSASQSTVSVNPSSVTADGSDSSAVSITVVDAQGNPISGAVVSIAVSGSGNTLSQPLNTDANGQTSGSFTTTVAEQKTVTVTVSGSVVLSSTPIVTTTSGPVSAGRSTVSSSPATIIADGADSSTVSIVVKDAQDNPISGSAVSIAVSGSGNSISQPSNSDASGQASGRFTSTVAEAKTVTVTVDGALVLSNTPVVTASLPPSAPTVSVRTPGVTVSGDVLVSYVVSDVQSDPVAVSVEFSTDDGATWTPATMGAGGDGATALVSSPAGVQHVFSWDTVADRVATTTANSDVRIRIVPSDAQTGVVRTSRRFVVENSDGAGSLLVEIDGGYDHFLALRSDGTVWSWGGYTDGQLGHGPVNNVSSAFGSVDDLTGVVEISARGRHSLALTSDGRVWRWGAGLPGTEDIHVPTEVAGLTDIVQISAGQTHVAVLRNDGKVFCMGDGTVGQMGDGSLSSSLTPVEVSGISDVVWIDAGNSHTLAVKADGTIWSWGANTAGNSDGTTAAKPTPFQISGVSNIESCRSGDSLIFLQEQDGTVWNWGNDNYGQLANGSGGSATNPTVTQLPAWKDFRLGDDHGVAIEASGRIVAWGRNYSGSPSGNPVPNEIFSAGTGALVGAGERRSFARKSDGTVWSWPGGGGTLTEVQDLSPGTLAEPFHSTYPAGGDAGLSLTPTLTWEPSRFASSFRIEIGVDPQLVTVDHSGVVSGASLQYLIPVTLVADSDYYWRVVALNAAGERETSSGIRSFRTHDNSVSPFPVAGPNDGAIDLFPTITLQWQDTTGETGYRVQVSSVADFTTVEIDDSSLSVDTVSFDIQRLDLEPGQMYWWRVWALTAGEPRLADGSPRSFGHAPSPEPVALVSPTNNRNWQPLGPTFQWTDSPDETSYVLQVGRNFTFKPSDIIFEKSLGADVTQYTMPSVLSVQTSYTWRVLASNGAGDTIPSTGTVNSNGGWSFQTARLPGIYDLSSPVELAPGQRLDLDLAWGNSDVAETYEIDIATDGIFTNVIHSASVSASNTSYSVPAGILQETTTYYWQVDARNLVGNRLARNNPRRFTTLTSTISDFDLTLPAEGTGSLPPEVHLEWTDATGETGYRVDIFDSGSMALAYTATLGADVLAHDVPTGSLTFQATYLWRVVAINATGERQGDDGLRRFVTGILPADFDLIRPISGRTNLSDRPLFRWSGSSANDSFLLEVATDVSFQNIVHSVPGIYRFGSCYAMDAAVLQPGTTYYWRVTSVGSAGSTVAGNAPWSFETSAAFPVESWSSIATAAVPTKRRHAAAVWTGKDLIVWGGQDGSTDLADGAIYSPDSDSWRAISTTGAPSARYKSIAVWTGRVMLVWGGFYYPGFSLGDGAAYDPIADSWRPISTTGAPSARGSQCWAWTGSELLCWGGRLSGSSTVVNEGFRYDPDADAWATMTSVGAPTPRTLAAMEWTGGKAIVLGGNYSSGSLGAKYDAVADSWLPISSSSAPDVIRRGETFWTGRELLVWRPQSTVGIESVIARYDFAADSWSTVPVPSQPDVAWQSLCGGWDGSKLILFGGTQESKLQRNGLAYDPATNLWRELSGPSGLDFRFNHSGVWTGAEWLFWGGENTSGCNEISGSITDSGWSLGLGDFGDGDWTDTASASTGRSEHAAHWTGRELIVWGGNRTDNTVPGNRGEAYDPRTDTWRNLPDPGIGNLERPGSVWTGRDLVIWGGHWNGVAKDVGSRYRPDTNQWSSVSSVGDPSARYGHTAIWSGQEMIVWGGTDGVSERSDGNSYDPDSDTWSTISSVGAPTARFNHTAVWTEREMIVWGGEDSSPLGSGARYDPVANSWSPISTVSAPAARTGHSAVWTGKYMMVWGGDPVGVSDTGGLYDPENDSWIATPVDPNVDGRNRFAMVWNGSHVLVFGGAAAFAPAAQPALFDPRTMQWTYVSSSTAAPLRDGVSAVWAGHGFLIFGGRVSSPQDKGYLLSPDDR